MITFKAGQKLKAVDHFLQNRYSGKKDLFGLNIAQLKLWVKLFFPIYRIYFQVKIENDSLLDPEKTYIVLANFQNKFPIDALLLQQALLFNDEGPTFVRPVFEQMLPAFPFLGKWSSEQGAVYGDKLNVLQLLEQNESILLIPQLFDREINKVEGPYRLKPFCKKIIKVATARQLQSVCLLPVYLSGPEHFYFISDRLHFLFKKIKLGRLSFLSQIFPSPIPVKISIGKAIEINSSHQEMDYIWEVEQSINALNEKKQIHQS